jgi:hypothetical protein
MDNPFKPIFIGYNLMYSLEKMNTKRKQLYDNDEEEKKKTVLVFKQTHELMQKFCTKGQTYAEFIDELLNQRFAKELRNNDNTSE